MATELSFTKRAAAELSRCFNGLNVSSSKANTSGSNSSSSPSSSSSAAGGAESQLKSMGNGQPVNSGPLLPKTGTSDSSDSSSSTSGFFTLANSVRSIGSAYERNIAAAKNAAQSSFRFGSASDRSSNCTTISTGTTLPTTPRKQPPKAPPKTARARRQNYLLGLSMQLPKRPDEIWTDPKLFIAIVSQCDALTVTQVVQVCKLWRDLVYEQPHIWRRMVARLDFSHIRRTSTLDDRIRWIRSLNRRSFDSVVVHGALDQEIAELPHAFASFSNLRSVALHCCGCNDSSLQQLLISCSTRLERLELISCNELSDGGHWLTACTQLNALSIADCINIADETIMAIGQTLPHLVELSVQAYHVTDQCFQYMRINSHLPNSQGFSSADMEAKLVAIEEKAIDDRIAEARLRRERRLRGSPTATRRSIRTEDQWSESVDSPLQALLLNNCWELSNQAMVQLAHCLPNLRYLSLSGCSKVTDEAIELIAQHLKHLQHIDLSWCHRLSDASLEFLACDLGDTLAELMLDRCTGITDIGLSYVAAIRSLKVLTLRWCLQLRDVGIQSLSPLSGLHVLSLSGCSMLTPNAFRSMDQLTSLKELELINCPAATDNLMVYLGQQLPSNCVIIK